MAFAGVLGSPDYGSQLPELTLAVSHHSCCMRTRLLCNRLGLWGYSIALGCSAWGDSRVGTGGCGGLLLGSWAVHAAALSRLFCPPPSRTAPCPCVWGGGAPAWGCGAFAWWCGAGGRVGYVGKLYAPPSAVGRLGSSSSLNLRSSVDPLSSGCGGAVEEGNACCCCA